MLRVAQNLSRAGVSLLVFITCYLPLINVSTDGVTVTASWAVLLVTLHQDRLSSSNTSGSTITCGGFCVYLVKLHLILEKGKNLESLNI